MDIKKIIKEEIEDFDWATSMPKPKDKKTELFDVLNSTFGIRYSNGEITDIDESVYGTPTQIQMYLLSHRPIEVFKLISGLSWVKSIFKFNNETKHIVLDWMNEMIGEISVYENRLDSMNEAEEFDWVSTHLDTVPDDPHHVALASCYGTDVINGVEEMSYTHYGITMYTNEDGEEYGVGDYSEFNEALEEYYDQLIDDIGLDGWNLDVDSYFYMSPADARFLASDLADMDVDGYSTDEMVENSSLSDEMEDVISEISELEDNISEKEDELVPLDEDSDEYIELQDEIDSLRERLTGLEVRKEDIYDEARDEFRDNRYETHRHGLEDDPVDYLINDLGLYSDSQELLDNNLVSFDRPEFIRDLVGFQDFGEMSTYDGEYCTETVDGTNNICIRVN